MRSARAMPMTLQALRESQRQLWKQKRTRYGSEPGAGTTEPQLRARLWELEWRLKELEAQLASQRS
jgi:hypothetical protein